MRQLPPLTCLREAARRYRARVYAYCLMPDHVHLVAQVPVGTDFSKFVNFFKQSAGLALRDVLGTRDPVWQPRFWDHGLRSDESLLAAAEYAWNNPVRAGLVREAGEYPYSGSLEWPDALERIRRVDPPAVAGRETTELKSTELRADAPPGTAELESTELHSDAALGTPELESTELHSDVVRRAVEDLGL